MPNIIKHKRNSVAGTIPATGVLDQGELGINIADGKLYTKNSSNSIINLGITSISGTSITPASGLFNNSIGIGTTTPSGQLHVIGTGIFSNKVGIGISGFPNWISQAATPHTFVHISGASGLFPDANERAFGSLLRLNSGASTNNPRIDFRIGGSGNFDDIFFISRNGTDVIGIDTFSKMFLPNGFTILNPTNNGEGGNASIRSYNDAASWITLDNNTRSMIIGYRGKGAGDQYIDIASSGRLKIYNYYSEVATFDNRGRFGIGTTTPTAQIHVIGSGLFSGDVTASGSFIGGSGTASLPSFEFTGDPDTGLFSPAANTFGISTSGVERLRVDSVGNIGIGTVTPSGKLHVSGTIIASGGNSTNWNTAYGWGNHAVAGYITNYIPDGITIFGGDGYIQNIVFENDGTPVADIAWDDPNDRLQINALQVNITAENGLIVETQSPIQFNPYGGGNVGIGIVNPTSKLHVAGDILATGSFIGGSGTASLPSFEFINDPDTGLFSPAANTLAISTSGVERLRVDNAGSISMSGSLNVDPQNAGQINCMYVNAGQALGGSLSTDNLYVNQAIMNQNYTSTISLSDSISMSSEPGANITLYDSVSISSNAGANITLTDNIGISCGGDLGLNGYSIALTCDPSATIELNGVVNVNGNLTFDSFTESVVANGNSGTSKTLSLASGTVHTCTLTNNCTFTMPTATAGKSFSVFLNSGSGNYTASFSGVRWADSAIPTATITASKVDIYSFISDGSFWYGSFSQNYG
jgi:hypothetical protein